jgi:hypothetical protein
LRDIFSEIYSKGIWNSNNVTIPKSGPGSTLENAKNFINFLDSFCASRDIDLIVDIGCGDMTWMHTTKSFSVCNYTGIDIVPSLIESNRLKYPKQTFLNLNAIIEELPSGDVVIVRDVLFHLCHDDIRKLLQNIRGKYKYYLLTSCDNTSNDDVLDTYHHYHRVNLTIQPFNIHKYADSIDEPVFQRKILCLDNCQFEECLNTQ